MKTRILLPLVQAGGETFKKKKSKTKTKTETKTNCCDAEEKEDEEGSGSCCTCARSATKFSLATKIKIATRSLRNEHARKVHENCTLPERAQKAKGEIHTRFRGEENDPQINN
jgi:hypothetical protein